MSYKVYVSQIKNLQKHPNADRLQIGEVLGNLVIVGLETQDGELGLFFPPDGEISREFLEAHDLYERKGLDNKKAGGYFGANGKVRGVTLRGVKTDGFWFKVKDLKPEWTPSNLEEGQEFESANNLFFAQMNSKPLARKFFTEASRKKQDNIKTNKPKEKKPPKAKVFGLDLHYNTPRFQERSDFIKKIYDNPSRVIITEKVHGTSQRTGIAKVYRNPETWWEKLKDRFGFYDGFSWEFRVGTRTVNLQDEKGGFYGSNEFRFKAVEALRTKLLEGECIYHEVVGYQGTKPIQPAHNLEKVDKALKGKLNHYTYGCEPGDAKIYVYRITQMLPDGSIKELNWQDVESRCHELGIETVPVLRNVDWGVPEYNPFQDELWWHEEPGRGLSPTFKSMVEGGPQIAEGVCIRVEQAGMLPVVLKLKNVSFGLMEGYIKERPDFVDIEEEEQAQEQSDEQI